MEKSQRAVAEAAIGNFSRRKELKKQQLTGGDRSSNGKAMQVDNYLAVMDARESKYQWRRMAAFGFSKPAIGGKLAVNRNNLNNNQPAAIELQQQSQLRGQTLQ